MGRLIITYYNVFYSSCGPASNFPSMTLKGERWTVVDMTEKIRHVSKELGYDLLHPWVGEILIESL